MQDEVITALEHRPGWVRHDQGWSVSRVRGDSWLWLVPEHPQEIAAGVQMVEGSDNTLSPSLLMHSPSAEASAAARAAFEAVAPGSSEQIIEKMSPLQVILPTAPAVSNDGGSSPLLVPLPAVSCPWVPAWGSLEPPR